jgi:hypothetical protein
VDFYSPVIFQLTTQACFLKPVKARDKKPSFTGTRMSSLTPTKDIQAAGEACSYIKNSSNIKFVHIFYFLENFGLPGS